MDNKAWALLVDDIREIKRDVKKLYLFQGKVIGAWIILGTGSGFVGSMVFWMLQK